ncbi:succinic semialdehyde dehydrogenase [Nocardioides marmoribigeumensis]|uniref:Aldehyde dehydrogenase (NAD+)/succinate-semialdehyde dehydrogenase/glutarate-semialdehyde dehydrogenase n=1 Tax=Nocardioides marmoribigeumensis TaxID=433649 RepID=A0ABU2BSL5_9ACTN|nr:succinic semialdehyde dehydrogenase [Nocardioides marmoribigeumensis]MDR7361623.1 aldehyde dehydrogenase (NAD+)/succinate-semialdehyde dehydrogenase/glutarate-semialdehyde dehydrogenase [Nocardioides marmoribigeumensis]
MSLPVSIDDALLARLTGAIAADGASTYKLTEVYTGELICELPQSSPADIEQAYADARVAQREWRSWPLKQRLAVMRTFHSLLLKEWETVVDLMQAETGKARRMSFEEVCDVAMTTSHYLKHAKRILSEHKRGGVVPFVSTSTEVRVPKGVVAVISPWNFPFATSLSDSMPALIAGNGVVLKPDNKSALCVTFGVELLHRAGMPEGLVQVVCGEGADVGPALIDGADYVMFTGSTATGRFVGERAGANLIDCTLELGGKNPLIVMPDADLDEVVPGALFGSFLNAGQACMHIERIYVPRSMEEEFTRRFVIGASKIALGATYDWEPMMGGLISTAQLERVSSHVEDAREKGAEVLTGGRARPDLGPTFYEPTVLRGVTKDMVHGVQETFGPVTSIHTYDDLDHAVELANDTDYGLNASVWGTDLEAAEALGRRIEAGNININDSLAASYASKASPSGGIKQSGVGGRHGDAGMLKYTDPINVAVLKKQVLTPDPSVDYAKYAKQTVTSLRAMRKLGVR